jgi:putative MATE family efflux protein
VSDASPPPRFVSGSTLRHVVVMTTAGSVGLVAVFAVDFLSLLYISWLGDPVLTAAVGLATIVLFFAVSINVGLMIAVGAVVSRALGRRDVAAARRLSGSAAVHLAAVALAVTLLLLALLDPFLRFLGASPETLPVAKRFLWITLPSNVLMAVGMGFSGTLRAVGDAKRAMYVTLTGAVVTVWLDPLLIFGLGLGVDGAAMATVVSRVLFVVVGFHGAARIHRLVGRPSLAALGADARPLYAVAVPAALTNIATPVGSAFVVSVLATFGDEVIAANAVIDRIALVAFGGLFALSGAVGPILGQNWGAQRFDRMRGILRDGILFSGVYVGLVWIVLVLLRHRLADLFHLGGLGADLLVFFCLVSGPLWFFNGLLFVANAAFNNLGFPFYSTAFNWARATIGTIPFAYLGARLAGPEGAIAGVGLGFVVFGLAAIVTASRTIGLLARRAGHPSGAAGVVSQPP